MTTYNSYEEAKIENPECEIYQLERNGLFAHCDYHKDELVRFVEFDSAGIKCTPADHCMTVEKFLADGNKFQVGDLFIGTGGDVIDVEVGVHLEEMHRNQESDRYRYILRAAALEEKKPRTKVDYMKCEFESFSDVYSSIISDGEVYGYEVDGYRPRCYLDESGSFIWRYKERCASYSGLKGVDINQLYRRIETPMTEREMFIEGVEKIGAELTENGDWSFACLAAEIFDSKLVN